MLWFVKWISDSNGGGSQQLYYHDTLEVHYIDKSPIYNAIPLGHT